MGFYKLREWVGTVIGKGDRWGRDRLGRSAPAFLSANTTALPPFTCTAWREAGQLCGSCCFRCEAGQLWAVCFFEACAGRRIRWLCPPAVAVQQAFCLPAILPAMPTALISSCPISSFALFAPVPSMCARIVIQHYTNMFASCKTVPLAAATRACSGGPCAGSNFDISSFSCRVHDPGPWV